MTAMRRIALWAVTFGFAIYNLIQLDLLTAIALWLLCICVELQAEQTGLERWRRERAEDWTRQYARWASGGFQRKPAKVINLRNSNGDEAA